jgi:hypothetical protein
MTVELCACARAMNPSRGGRTERCYCKPRLQFNTPSPWEPVHTRLCPVRHSSLARPVTQCSSAWQVTGLGGGTAHPVLLDCRKPFLTTPSKCHIAKALSRVRLSLFTLWTLYEWNTLLVCWIAADGARRLLHLRQLVRTRLAHAPVVAREAREAREAGPLQCGICSVSLGMVCDSRAARDAQCHHQAL